MNKKNKLLTSLLVSTQLLGIIAPMQVSATEELPGIIEGQEIIDYEAPEIFDGHTFTEKELDEISTRKIKAEYSVELDARLDELLYDAQNIGNTRELNQLIRDFTSIDEYFNTDDVVDYMVDKDAIGYGKGYTVHAYIREHIYNLGDKGSPRLINYMNQLVMGVTRDVDGFEYLVNDIYETNEIVAADLETYRVHTLMFAYINATEYGDDFELKVVGGRLISPYHEREGIEIGVPNGAQDIEREPVIETPLPENNIRTDDDAYRTSDRNDYGSNLEGRSGQYYEFDEVSGRRIRVDYTIEYVNGKQQRRETRTVEATGLTSMWSDNYSEMFGNVRSNVTARHDVDDEKEEKSRLTLQYTLNKSDKFPTYIDTGLFSDINGNVKYIDLYEVLYQIAVNADEGFLVEDSDKLLVVIEGKPVYIVDTKQSYTQSEVEDIFEGFEDVGLLVTETRIGTTNSLEWQIKTGQEQKVIVDGRGVSLKNSPDIRGERVVLPIEEVMTAIGGDVSQGENLLTVRYGDNVVSFELGVSQARVNGNLVDLTVPVEADDKGTLTANLTPIFEQLGIESVWDEQESSLYLDNTLAATTEDVEEFENGADESDDSEDEEESDEE